MAETCGHRPLTLTCVDCGTSVTVEPTEEGTIPLAPLTGWSIDTAVRCPTHTRPLRRSPYFYGC